LPAAADRIGAGAEAGLGLAPEASGGRQGAAPQRMGGGAAPGADARLVGRLSRSYLQGGEGDTPGITPPRTDRFLTWQVLSRSRLASKAPDSTTDSSCLHDRGIHSCVASRRWPGCSC